jgi:hypothetical protein
VHDHFQARTSAIAEDVDSPIKWVDVEAPATDATEAIQTVPEVNRGDADENLQVWDELQHALTGEGTS